MSIKKAVITSFKIIAHFIVIVFLTVLTQAGGVIYLISIIAFRNLSILKRFSFGLLLYFVSVVLIVPFLAKIGDRVPLPFSGNIAPYTIITCLLNRHYVNSNTKTSLEHISDKFIKQYPGNAIYYLDANFPFFDGFPLLPHLSHSDGKKLDLAFYYQKNKKPVRQSSSFIGYGFYDSPKSSETNYTNICTRKGYWQYDLIGKIIPMRQQEKYSVNTEKTQKLIRLLNNERATQKIFIEPHLQTRWNLQKLQKIRFHGCQAVRHDDHIHWQTK